MKEKKPESMKKKLGAYLLLTGFLTLAATLVITVLVFHHMYREQILDDMRTYAELFGEMIFSGEELPKHADFYEENLRVTAISPEGEVLFDNQTGAEAIGNHADRPEVQEAAWKGEGYAIRHSDTLNRDLYYYAVRLANGDVLRISKEEDNIWSVFQNTIHGIVVVGLLMFLVCVLLSHYVTNLLVRPIERLAADMETVGETETYEELEPFIATIRKQHEDIVKGARMRQEFTANVSHELKTPLTSISGYAELMETGMAGEREVQRFASEIHRNAKRLLTLINDIIRLSELDAAPHGSEMPFAEVDLYELARTCADSLRFNAENYDLQISCRGEHSVVRGSRDMLEELLSNLMDNAIRYNRPGGRVEVIVQQEPWPQEESVAGGFRMDAQNAAAAPESLAYPALVVRDTGIGIPQESQARVFERFYRVDKSRSKQTGGTGLGLAIVKHIVAQHQAGLWMKSEVGKGTEVHVVFLSNLKNTSLDGCI